MVNEAQVQEYILPTGAGASRRVAPGMCWYLTATGEIIRGPMHRDSDWEDRKAMVFGGMTFLGRAQYGPGGDSLPALRQFHDAARDPKVKATLADIIQRNIANTQARQYNIDHAEEIRREKKAAEKALEAAALAQAIRMVNAEEASQTEQPRRRPGRPRKVEQDDAPEE